MGSFNILLSNLNTSLHLLLFSLLIFNLTTASAQSLLQDPINDLVCSLVNCGQGTCVASNTSVLGFECECFPGWKTIQIGPLAFPSCVPNCTLDFQCGNGAPPPPPPPPPPPALNLTSPCTFVWCADGNCVVNGTGHYCECFDGSANLLDNPELACFKQCYFGADCNVKLGSPSAPPPSKSGSPGNGPNVAANCSRKLHAVTILVLSAIFLTWI